jgi:hypothetical protein
LAAGWEKGELGSTRFVAPEVPQLRRAVVELTSVRDVPGVVEWAVGVKQLPPGGLAPVREGNQVSRCAVSALELKDRPAVGVRL